MMVCFAVDGHSRCRLFSSPLVAVYAAHVAQHSRKRHRTNADQSLDHEDERKSVDVDAAGAAGALLFDQQEVVEHPLVANAPVQLNGLNEDEVAALDVELGNVLQAPISKGTYRVPGVIFDPSLLSTEMFDELQYTFFSLQRNKTHADHVALSRTNFAKKSPVKLPAKLETLKERAKRFFRAVSKIETLLHTTLWRNCAIYLTNHGDTLLGSIPRHNGTDLHHQYPPHLSVYGKPRGAEKRGGCQTTIVRSRTIASGCWC